MKLSQTATYAVHAALRLAMAGSNAPVPSGRLAQEGKMPERFLLQILRDMAKRGILQATRGGGGGFRLARDPSEISLLELIEAVDGPLGSGLPDNSNLPEASAAALQRALSEVARTVRRQLETVKLSHLLAAPSADKTLAPVAFQPGPHMAAPISMPSQPQAQIDA